MLDISLKIIYCFLMILPIQISKWEILTPDDLTNGHTYKTFAEAEKAKIEFLKRFKTQGYYSTALGEIISLEDLEDRVSIVEKK